MTQGETPEELEENLRDAYWANRPGSAQYPLCGYAYGLVNCTYAKTKGLHRDVDSQLLL